MATPRSGNDVFEMVMAMERTGKDFYEALAMACDDPDVRGFCVRAAKDEMNHLSSFREMRSIWTKSVGSDSRSTPEAVEALAAMTKGRIQPDPNAVRKVALHGTLKDAVILAMEMEQDAIQFYGGLISSLPDAAKAIQGIVDQERRHLAALQKFAL